MPEMDGFEATQAVRTRESRDGSARTSIVALTANAMEGDRGHCIAAGMDDFLSKPYTKAQLRAVLTRSAGDREATLPPDVQPQSLDAGTIAELEKLGVETALRIVRLYLTRSPPQVGKLMTAIEQRQSETVCGLSHRLKGSSRALGAMELGTLLQQIETNAHQGRDEDNEALLAALSTNYQHVVAQLRQLEPTLSSRAS